MYQKVVNKKNFHVQLKLEQDVKHQKEKVVKQKDVANLDIILN